MSGCPKLWKKRWLSALALVASLAAEPGLSQTSFDSGAPAPPSGAVPASAPPIGCVYVLPTFALPVSQAGVAVTCDGTGALRITASGIKPTVAGSASSSLVIKSGPGTLYNAYATCTAACWLMIFNATSAPADGATTPGTAAGNLQDCIPIPAGGTNGVSYGTGPGETFSTGITAVISSTACATKTAATTGFVHGSAQ